MKRKTKTSYEEWIEPSYIIGTGQYQRIGDPDAKTKIKNRIGFVRQPIKAANTRPRKK